MNKKFYEKILTLCLENNCEYAEIYLEESKSTKYALIDSKLDDIITSNNKGIGIRIISNSNVYYTSTNNLTEENILLKVNNLIKSIPNSKKRKVTFKLGTKIKKYPQVKIPHSAMPFSEKLKILKEIDQEIRSYSPLISQVNANFIETTKDYTIVTTEKKYISSQEISTRLTFAPYATKDGKTESTFKSLGTGTGYEMLEGYDYKKESREAAKIAVNKLSASKFKGGKVPVILGPGFGAVIFHEACVHPLEATTVADNLSVFSNCLNTQIATPKVTIIDDGSIPSLWGSTLIDSEGNPTQKNILIENGILKSYLVDKANTKTMNHPLTGSARRQNYRYPPTSRMNNTYLKEGTDTFSDMVKNIDYGIYCKKLAGGSVNPKTGDFNFSADESYLIENGKITDMITGITLIGRGQEILNKVEMVSNDLKLETGYCGSVSGTINVTIGQPTIKVSEILVGGEN